VGEDGPKDPQMLVGDGHEGFVIADSAMQCDDPLFEPGTSDRFSFERNLQRGARALGEQAAQVTVAAFGNDAETLLATGAVLPWHESGPGGHLASVLEVAWIGHGSEQCAGGQFSDAGDRQNALGLLIVLDMRVDLSIALSDTVIEAAQVFERAGEDRAEVLREPLILRELRKLANENCRGASDPYTELGQQTASTVQQRGALHTVAAAGTMPGEHRLLIHRLDRHEAHVRLSHGGEDRLRIVAIVLGALAFAKRGDKFRRHELRMMTVLSQKPRPVVRRAARLYPERARGQFHRPFCKALKTELFEVLRAALNIPSAHHDDFFCQVHTDSSNLVHEFPFSAFRLITQTQSWHFDAVRPTPLQGRGTPLYSVGATDRSFGEVGRDRMIGIKWLRSPSPYVAKLHR